ncbi:MAG: hypothetical protein ACK4WH_02125 [Phycisphaerales bacterium]
MGDSLYRCCGIVLITLAGLLGGCAATGAVSESDKGGAASGVRFESGPARDPGVVGVAADEVLDGDRLGMEFVAMDPAENASMTLDRRGSADGWAEVRRECSGAGGTVASQTTLQRVGGGGEAIVEEVVNRENVRVVYEPPMVSFPSSLTAGSEHRQRTRMTVHPLAEPERVKARGHVESVVTVVGAERVRTPAGEFDAVHLRHTFVADLAPARVTNTADRWYARRVGLIAERRAERTTVAGVPIRSSAESWVLKAPPSR